MIKYSTKSSTEQINLSVKSTVMSKRNNMKKIFTTLVIALNLNATELPSYHCVNTYEASFIEADGSIKPEVKKASGRSKLNIMVEEKRKRGQVIMITYPLFLLITPLTAGCDMPNTLAIICCE